MLELLKGIKVVEVAPFYPAPFCTRLLLLLGAEVIKIEPPTGDPARAFDVAFAVFNAGKKILKLDLKSEGGRNEFFEIVKDADVLVEGYRPGVAKRLGIDYENIRKINPKIIYCSISAFGQESKLRHLPAHDLNILGLAGILEISEFRDPNVQLSDFASAVYATILILASLFEREKTGFGRYIDVSMFHSAIFSIPIHSTTILNGLGIISELSENPVYSVYKTSDGYVTIGIISEEHFWRNLCRELGLNFDFSLEESFKRYDEVKKAIEEKLKGMKTKEVVEKLQKADIPVFEVKSLRDIEEIEELIGEKLVEEVEFEGKTVKLIKPPFKTIVVNR